jgi:hypothetical protein
VKFGVLCLLLLPACFLLETSDEPYVLEYEVTWICLSPEGCERTDEVSRIDYLTVTNYYDFHYTSTQDDSFGLDVKGVDSDTLEDDCLWLVFPPLFGQELEWAKTCHLPGGLDTELSIPNADPATSSRWFMKQRDPSLD